LLRTAVRTFTLRYDVRVVGSVTHCLHYVVVTVTVRYLPARSYVTHTRTVLRWLRYNTVVTCTPHVCHVTYAFTTADGYVTRTLLLRYALHRVCRYAVRPRCQICRWLRSPLPFTAVYLLRITFSVVLPPRYRLLLPLPHLIRFVGPFVLVVTVVAYRDI